MALNIKNPEADRLAHEIAEITGESLTKVVVDALRDRREELAHRREAEKKSEKLLEIGRRASKHLAKDLSTDDLYDEIGLPR
ncbi:MAG: type II toxin-antitoxin system VapB family antitoxin [Alphaproteobacteria bacterium]